jgi:serine/threonine protein kinase
LSQTPPHQRFGQYQIIERINGGGMAEVFKARVEGLGGFARMFAIKRVHPDHADNPEYVDMLIEEAKIAGLLSHANIVQIVDLGEVDKQPFIAMEYVNGPDLEAVGARLKDRGTVLPIPHAIFICLELLKALEYAHDRQVMRGGRPVPLDIIHRDICPSNVLISLKGEVKLTDFGIAKASVRNLDTITGIIKGRFDYLSPEQSRGEDATQRSDIFSVGILLYEMLTGRHPFAQASQVKTIEAIKMASFVPAVAFNPEVPPALDRLLGQTLTADPAKRFGSATALKDALNLIFHEGGYIFSNATLSAYLRGLFPELIGDLPKDDDTEADENQETRPFLRGQRPVSAEAGRVETEEMPTTERPGANRLHAPIPNRPLTALDTSLSGFFGPIDDESTIVGPKKTKNQNWPDLDTKIHPVIDTAMDGPTRPGNTQGPSDTADTRISGAKTRAGNHPAISKRHKRKNLPPRASPHQQHAQVRRAQMLSLAVGVIIVVIALLVGFWLGNKASGINNQPVTAMTIPADPRLEIYTPEGAALSIDGREVAGTSPYFVTITPGQAHTVRISKIGYFPVETRLSLRKNDVRVLSFEYAEQHKKK